MDKQIKYLVGILIVMLISAYFLSLLGGLPQLFKDDIIAFLEERFSGEISFSSVSLWPLNRIRLNDFQFKAEDGSVFKTESFNFDYSLNFNQEHFVQIEFIELLGAEIELQEQFFDLNQLLAAENGSAETDFKTEDILAELELPELLADMSINIRDANLILNTEEIDLRLSELQFGLQAESALEYSASFSGAVKLNRLQLPDGLDFASYELSRLDLKFSRNREDASLNYRLEDFSLPAVVDNLPENNLAFQNLELDLRSLQGSASARGELIFRENEIYNYQTQLELEQLSLRSRYNYASGEAETINISAPFLSLRAEGPDLSLLLAESRVLINQEALTLSGSWEENQNYQLRLQADNFSLKEQFVTPYLEEGTFDFVFNLRAENQQLKTAAGEISAAGLKSEYADLESAEISFLLEEDEFFLNQGSFLLADQGELSLQGSYKLDQNKYFLKAEAEDFFFSDKFTAAISELNLEAGENYSAYLNKVENKRLNFKVDAAGNYGQEQELSAVGEFNLSFQTAASNSNFELDTAFWYTDNRLLLDSFKLFSDYGRLDLMGEIDLAAEKMQLRYAARDFELSIINEFLETESVELNEINPAIDYLEGSISNSFTDPTINIKLKMKELNYEEYQLRDLRLAAV